MEKPNDRGSPSSCCQLLVAGCCGQFAVDTMLPVAVVKAQADTRQNSFRYSACRTCCGRHTKQKAVAPKGEPVAGCTVPATDWQHSLGRLASRTNAYGQLSVVQSHPEQAEQAASTSGYARAECLERPRVDQRKGERCHDRAHGRRQECSCESFQEDIIMHFGWFWTYAINSLGICLTDG